MTPRTVIEALQRAADRVGDLSLEAMAAVALQYPECRAWDECVRFAHIVGELYSYDFEALRDAADRVGADTLKALAEAAVRTPYGAAAEECAQFVVAVAGGPIGGVVFPQGPLRFT